MLSAFTKFYSSADNLVSLIYENFRATGFEQISWDLDNKKQITQKKLFGARSPEAKYTGMGHIPYPMKKDYFSNNLQPNWSEHFVRQFRNFFISVHT